LRENVKTIARSSEQHAGVNNASAIYRRNGEIQTGKPHTILDSSMAREEIYDKCALMARNMSTLSRYTVRQPPGRPRPAAKALFQFSTG
jgi:hypothetical protein